MTKQDIINHCLTFNGVFEDYPFDEQWTCMRHTANKKTFAMIYLRNNTLCINLKCDPMKADFLRSIFHSVSPGYHMNKQHWNTVTIGGDAPDNELYNMIQDSFNLTMPKIKNKKNISPNINT